MAVLVIADHDGSAVRDTTNKTVTAALALSSDVDVLVVGENAKVAADAAAKITGVRKVLLAESAGLGKALAEASPQRARPILAVGDTTATTAEGLGFTDVTSANGNVEALAELVLELPGDPHRHAVVPLILGEVAHACVGSAGHWMDVLGRGFVPQSYRYLEPRFRAIAGACLS